MATGAKTKARMYPDPDGHGGAVGELYPSRPAPHHTTLLYTQPPILLKHPKSVRRQTTRAQLALPRPALLPVTNCATIFRLAVTRVTVQKISVCPKRVSRFGAEVSLR